MKFLKMKILLILILILSCNVGFCQDMAKIRQIDDVVKSVNMNLLPTQRDSIIQDYPEMGLKIISYISMIQNDKELIKYENLVKTTRKENTEIRKMTTSSSFYYSNNKLIKVEEFSIEEDVKKTMDWYYSDGEPFFHTLKSDKAADRAALLLKIANGMLEKVIK